MNLTYNKICFLKCCFQNLIVTLSIDVVYGKYLHQLILGLAKSCAKFVAVGSSKSAIT